mmetsp:Transcript_57486/g.136735  ORF Transcript_57486/g.136735 Transcript_57486/m.136735 type:complete len:245 (+) Transcript_57486:57-791(+)
MADAQQNVKHNAYKDPVAEMQKQVAKETAKQSAKEAQKQAKAGFIEVKAFVMENPASIRVISFLVGLTLMVVSVLGCTIAATTFGAREYLTNFYNVIFGIVICISEGRDSWTCCCNLQERLFNQFFFLATVTGRATFYFFVGSMTLLVLPHLDEWFWEVIYVVLGFALVLIALCQYFLYFFGAACGCSAHKDALDLDVQPSAPSQGASSIGASSTAGDTVPPAAAAASAQAGGGKGYGQFTDEA